MSSGRDRAGRHHHQISGGSGVWAVTVKVTATDGLASTATATADFDHPGTPQPPSTKRTLPVQRIGGGDRYQTGVLVSRQQWADASADMTGRSQAQAVVLATGANFPDALAGVPLAAHLKGPLLLTDPAALIGSTEAEIRRVLGTGSGKTVYLLGGEGAVHPAVAEQLTRDGYQVVRYGGADRFATALQIATLGLGSPAKVVVATGRDYPDALSAGPLAATQHAAIVLSDGSSLTPADAACIAAHTTTAPATGPDPAVTAVAGPAVGAVSAAGIDPRQASGPDRYATAASVAAVMPPGTATSSAPPRSWTPSAAPGRCSPSRWATPRRSAPRSSRSPPTVHRRHPAQNPDQYPCAHRRPPAASTSTCPNTGPGRSPSTGCRPAPDTDLRPADHQKRPVSPTIQYS